MRERAVTRSRADRNATVAVSPMSITEAPELVDILRSTMPCFDGTFEFLCGGDEHTSVGNARSVHAHHLLDRDPDNLRDFRYLRRGCFVSYLGDQQWSQGELPPEDE